VGEHRKAEGRPRTGRTRTIPTTRRGAVPGVADQTGLSKHALGPVGRIHCTHASPGARSRPRKLGGRSSEEWPQGPEARGLAGLPAATRPR
jgi:hypothetical protein